MPQFKVRESTPEEMAKWKKDREEIEKAWRLQPSQDGELNLVRQYNQHGEWVEFKPHPDSLTQLKAGQTYICELIGDDVVDMPVIVDHTPNNA